MRSMTLSRAILQSWHLTTWPLISNLSMPLSLGSKSLPSSRRSMVSWGPSLIRIRSTQDIFLFRRRLQELLQIMAFSRSILFQLKILRDSTTTLKFQNLKITCLLRGVKCAQVSVKRDSMPWVRFLKTELEAVTWTTMQTLETLAKTHNISWIITKSFQGALQAPDHHKTHTERKNTKNLGASAGGILRTPMHWKICIIFKSTIQELKMTKRATIRSYIATKFYTKTD